MHGMSVHGTMNCPAASSQRTIMDEPIAFFRNAQGKVGASKTAAAIAARRLTDGKVVENGLQCGYHGLVFDTKGKCVEIPGQDAIPTMAHIKHYPRRRTAGPSSGSGWAIPRLPMKARSSTGLSTTDKKLYPHRKAYLPHQGQLPHDDRQPDGPHPSRLCPFQDHRWQPSVACERQDGRRAHREGLQAHTLDGKCSAAADLSQGVPFAGKIDRWQEFEYVLPGCVLQMVRRARCRLGRARVTRSVWRSSAPLSRDHAGDREFPRTISLGRCAFCAG